MKSWHFYGTAQCSSKNSMTLSSFSMTFVIFHDFPGLENGLPKFHDFRWPGAPWDEKFTPKGEEHVLRRKHTCTHLGFRLLFLLHASRVCWWCVGRGLSASTVGNVHYKSSRQKMSPTQSFEHLLCNGAGRLNVCTSTYQSAHYHKGKCKGAYPQWC